jgi:hypothetical protein
MYHKTMSHRPRHNFIAAISAGSLLILLFIGCVGAPKKPVQPQPQIPQAVPMHTVINRINANSRAMDFLLKGGGITATGEYLHNGRLEPFEAHGDMVFRKPRDLYLKLDHLAGSIIIGSNNDRWWVWNKIENRYFWSRHDDVIERSGPLETPIRPDHFVEVLGLNELPSQTAGALGPVFWVSPTRYELNFLDRDRTGQLYYTKAVDIDRRPPYLIREIVYFKPDGQTEIKAELSDYEAVSNTPNAKVLAPRQVRIKWLTNQSWLNLTFASMKRFEKELVLKLIERSPRQRGSVEGAEIIRVGRPPLPEVKTSQPAAQSSDP